jgi:hypothetical protein
MQVVNETRTICASCGAQNILAGPNRSCPVCGAPTESAGNILVLVAWLFIPFAIPAYPVLGSIGTLAMAVAHAVGSGIGLSDGFRLIGIAAAGYAAMFFGLRVERSLSGSALYRTLRKVFRVLLLVLFAGGVLFGSGRDLSSGAALMIVFVGLPILVFIVRRFDRVFGMGAPAKVAPPSSP